MDHICTIYRPLLQSHWLWLFRCSSPSLLRRYASNKSHSFFRPSLPPWTPTEDHTIQTLKKAGKTFREISALLPGRSRENIVQRYYKHLRPANETDIHPSTPWTAADIAKLIAARSAPSNNHWDAIAELFPSRSKIALQFAFYKYRPASSSSSAHSSRDTWLPADDAVVLQARNEQRQSWADVAARLPGRSVDAVKARYVELDPYSPLVYTSARNMEMRDIAVARRLRAEGRSWTEVAREMKGEWARTSLRDRVRAVERFPGGVLPKRKKWSPEEDERLVRFVREHGGCMDGVERELGRTIRACQARMRALRFQGVEEESG